MHLTCAFGVLKLNKRVKRVKLLSPDSALLCMAPSVVSRADSDSSSVVVAVTVPLSDDRGDDSGVATPSFRTSAGRGLSAVPLLLGSWALSSESSVVPVTMSSLERPPAARDESSLLRSLSTLAAVCAALDSAMIG